MLEVPAPRPPSKDRGFLHGVRGPVGFVNVSVDGLHGADHVHAVLVVHGVGLRDIREEGGSEGEEKKKGERIN